MIIASDDSDHPDDREGDGTPSTCDHASCRDEDRTPGSLAEQYPHLLAQWDCTQPGPSPWRVRPATDKKLHWFHMTADGARHQWVATGGSRAKLAAGCGVCRPRKGATPGINDLVTRRPDLVAQWCTEHQTRRPESVSTGSKYRACWACTICGFHARLAVYAKVAGNGCRRCSGQVALPGDPRTLAVAAPGRYAELDPTSLPAGFDPATLLVGSNRVTRWNCRHCGASYAASPNARAHGVGCKHCTKQSSGVERDLRAALSARLPGFDAGSAALPISWNSGTPHRPQRRSLRVDIHHPGRRVVVEYDGRGFHHRPRIVMLDTLKTQLLLAHGYTVIRVRENDLPDLDLNHPRLRQVRHIWGSDIEVLAETLSALIRSITHDPEDPDEPTCADSADPT